MSIADELIDFASITQTGIYAKVLNIPWAPSEEPQELSYYLMASNEYYYAQASIWQADDTYVQRKPGEPWMKIWTKSGDSRHAALDDDQIALVRKIIKEEIAKAFETEEHEHKYEQMSTPCPDGIVGCAVYHTELRCTICGRTP